MVIVKKSLVCLFYEFTTQSLIAVLNDLIIYLKNLFFHLMLLSHDTKFMIFLDILLLKISPENALFFRYT